MSINFAINMAVHPVKKIVKEKSRMPRMSYWVVELGGITLSKLLFLIFFLLLFLLLLLVLLLQIN